jgi:hypothetical protein
MGIRCPWESCGVHVEYTATGQTTHWTPQGYGRDKNGRQVADLLPATSVPKAASIAALSGVRQGSRVTLTVSATYYSPTRRSYVRSHGRMLGQHKDPGTTTWKSLANVTPITSGRATYILTTNRAWTTGCTCLRRLLCGTRTVQQSPSDSLGEAARPAVSRHRSGAADRIATGVAPAREEPVGAVGSTRSR